MCKCQRDRYKDPATENEKVINLREEVIKRLEQTVGNGQFLRNEPMKKHITFRVGGPAACFLMPSTKEQIEEIVHICQEEKTPCFILGNGSNLLVSDQGYDGAVLQIYKNMNQVAVNGCRTYRHGICSGNSGNSGRRCSYECRRLRRGDERYSGIRHCAHTKGRTEETV